MIFQLVCVVLCSTAFIQANPVFNDNNNRNTQLPLSDEKQKEWVPSPASAKPTNFFVFESTDDSEEAKARRQSPNCKSLLEELRTGRQDIEDPEERFEKLTQILYKLEMICKYKIGGKNLPAVG